MTTPFSQRPTPDPVDMTRTFDVGHVHRVLFTHDAFAPGNHILRDVLEASPDSTGRCVIFVDDGVARAWPELPTAIADYARAHEDVMTLAGEVCVVRGGEASKNDRSVVDRVAQVIDSERICRHSYVIGIGGGAMLDAVGFGAAIAHRGVRMVRFPTTTLAQGDAGIGVKNGINAFGKKNFLGTFGVPWAVINDEAFLTTLADRDWRAGLSEAVKVAALKDEAFFRSIVRAAPRLRRRDATAASPIIRRSAELHLDHIALGGDPFERDNARPLDFGHWAAHKLEQMSDFAINHGEAVAIGIALDTVYAVLAGLLEPRAGDEVLDCLADIGFVLYDDRLDDHATLLRGLEEFREHLGGRLTITLLERIGRDLEVHEIDRSRMIDAIGRLAARAASRHAG